MKRIILTLFVVGLAIFGQAQPARADGICMTDPTIPIPADLAAVVYDVLNTEPIPVAECYAIINYSEYSGHQALASVVGFDGDPANWNIEEHAIWFSLVGLEQAPLAGAWSGALQGSGAFTEMIGAFPITDEARQALGGETNTGTFFDDWGEGSGDVYFPFAGGTSAIYGTRGVHSHGNMRAVDFVSYNASGMAPNAVYAAQSGYVSNICRDDTQMGLKVGKFYYLHLVNDLGITEGMYFGTHDPIGRMVTGNFDDECGWASQQANHYHLHFAFSGNLAIEAWTLEGSNFVHDNGATRHPGQLIGPADWYGAAEPPDPETPPGEPPEELPPGEEPPENETNGEAGVSPLGTNFWSFLVGGFRGIVSRFSGVLPPHQSIELAKKIGEYAVLPVKIIYITGVMNYGFAFTLMGIVLVLEVVRFIYSLWMWVKRAIPVVG